MKNAKLKNGDFRKYYDKRLQRNIWVLGYFGGGSVYISDAYKLAKEYATECKVPVEGVKIDEILISRRFKGFKYIFSMVEQVANIDAERMDNVYGWLMD